MDEKSFIIQGGDPIGPVIGGIGGMSWVPMVIGGI